MESEYRNEEKRLDIMMEIERLKSLKFQEEREIKRKEAQREGALVIVDQIKERELQRIQEREIMEQEKQMILKQIDDLKKNRYPDPARTLPGQDRRPIAG